MEIRLRFILTTCTVNILLTFAPVLNEAVVGSIHDTGNVQKNIENLFDSVVRNNLQRGETIRDLLKHDVEKEQDAFDTIKAEFWNTRHRNIDEKKSEGANLMVKRETGNNNHNSSVHGEIRNAHEENSTPHLRASGGPSLHSNPYPNWDSTVKSTHYTPPPRSYRRPDNRPSHYRNEYEANAPSRQYDRPYDQQFYYGSPYYDPVYGQAYYDYTNTPQQYYYSQPAVYPNYREQYNDPRYGQQHNYPQQQYNQQYPQQENRDFRQTPSKNDHQEFTVRAHSSIADVPLSTQQNDLYSGKKKSKSMNANTMPTAKSISSIEIVNATETTSAKTEVTAAPTETMSTATTLVPTATTKVATTITARTATSVKTTRTASTATTGRTATSRKTARTTRTPPASSVRNVPSYMSRQRQRGVQYPQRQQQEPGERQYYPQPRQQKCHQVNRVSSTTLKPQQEEKKGRFSRLCKFVKGIFRKITFCKDEEEDEDEDEEEPKQPEQDKNAESYDRIDQRTSSYLPYRNYDPNYRPYRSRFQERNPDTKYFRPSSASYIPRTSYAIKDVDKGMPKQPQQYNNPQSYDRIDQTTTTTSYRSYRDFYPNRNFHYDQNYRPYQNGPEQRSPETNYFSPSSASYYYRRDSGAINQGGNFDDQRNYNRRFNYKPVHYDYNQPQNLGNEPKPGNIDNYGPDANNANGDDVNPETPPRLS